MAVPCHPDGDGLCILAVVAVPLRLRLWPKRPGPVLARSAIHGAAMLIYFGALAFLPVAQVAAGLFTAPIFVLLIQRVAYGQPIRGLQVLAVAVGFVGRGPGLGPEAVTGATFAALLPIIAGALYAMGNIATREWCAGETAETVVAGFFGMLGVMGLVGMAVLWAFPVPVPEGAEGFLQRGAVWPTGSFLWWTFVQAAGSLSGGRHDREGLPDRRGVEGVGLRIRDPARLGRLGIFPVGRDVDLDGGRRNGADRAGGRADRASVVSARTIRTVARPPRASDGGRG